MRRSNSILRILLSNNNKSGGRKRSLLYLSSKIGKLVYVLCLILLELSECEFINVAHTGCVLVGNNDGSFSCGTSTSSTTASTDLSDLPPQPLPFTLPQSVLDNINNFTASTISNSKKNNVLLPVQIFSPNMRFTVQTGATVRFPCSVQNLADNTLLWRQGANILAGIPDIPLRDVRRYRLLEDYTLELRNVVPEDQGSYECFITTTRPMMNVIHTLNVIDPPALSIEPDTGFMEVNEDDNITIGCIPKGNPLPQISWSKRDGIIPLNPKLLRRTHLRLQNISRKDAGVYVCKADNQVSWPAFGSIYIRVLYIPKITTPEPRIYTGVKYRTVISCNVDSDPQAEVHWLFKGERIPYSNRIYTEMIEKEHRLTFNGVRESDFGTYTCIAKNSLGYDLSHIELTGVPNPPVVTKWELSSCIPNSYSRSDDRIDNSTIRRQFIPRSSASSSSTSSPVSKSKALPRQTLFSTTLTSPDCSIQMTLFWVVESYGPLIDYHLLFRVVPISTSTVVSASNNKNNNDDTKLTLPWREITIPADPSISFIHTKSFTLFGLKNNSMFEGGVKARNKYGSSLLSKIIHVKIVADFGPPPRNRADRDRIPPTIEANSGSSGQSSKCMNSIGTNYAVIVASIIYNLHQHCLILFKF